MLSNETVVWFVRLYFLYLPSIDIKFYLLHKYQIYVILAIVFLKYNTDITYVGFGKTLAVNFF